MYDARRCRSSLLVNYVTEFHPLPSTPNDRQPFHSPAPFTCQLLGGSPGSVFSQAITLVTDGPHGPLCARTLSAGRTSTTRSSGRAYFLVNACCAALVPRDEVVRKSDRPVGCMCGVVIVFRFLSVEFIELKNDLHSRWNPSARGHCWVPRCEQRSGY